MARFFCDNCGAEVKRDTNRCPQCGRHFAFVRCPQCGFTGEESLFAKGCPGCGYCAPPKTENSGRHFRSANRPAMVAAGKLSPWVYVLAGLGLAAVLTVLALAVQ